MQMCVHICVYAATNMHTEAFPDAPSPLELLSLEYKHITRQWLAARDLGTLVCNVHVCGRKQQGTKGIGRGAETVSVLILPHWSKAGRERTGV